MTLLEFDKETWILTIKALKKESIGIRSTVYFLRSIQHRLSKHRADRLTALIQIKLRCKPASKLTSTDANIKTCLTFTLTDSAS